MQIANDLLGYPTSYYASELEARNESLFLLEMKYWLKKIGGSKPKDLY